jgi:hypothetical protein
MYRGNSSRVVPIILVLIVIAVAIAALVSVGRAIFGGDTGSQSQINVGRNALLNTAADHSVRMTVRGPIVADENFRSYQVTIDSSSRNLTTYSGYLDQMINFKQYDNNNKSYEQFVYALDKANMMNVNELTGNSNDTRGVCATGDLYEFEVLQDNNTVKSLWTSTCQGSSGSFKASVSQVQNLFLEQIPDSKTLLSGIDF